MEKLFFIFFIRHFFNFKFLFKIHEYAFEKNKEDNMMLSEDLLLREEFRKSLKLYIFYKHFGVVGV